MSSGSYLVLRRGWRSADFLSPSRAGNIVTTRSGPPRSTTKRIGGFAEKHKLMVGYHGHANVTGAEAFGSPQSWEEVMAYSKYNGANVDIGHFIAGNGFSPAEFIKKHHDRITNLHIKDRKKDQGPNVPWGQGDTPIKEILRLMLNLKY